MNADELLAWGRIEDAARKADIAAAKASPDMASGLRSAQLAAERRRKAVGLSMNQAASAVSAVQREARYAAMCK